VKSPVACDPRSCCFSVKNRVKVMISVLTSAVSELPFPFETMIAAVYVCLVVCIGMVWYGIQSGI
jgi:hypothetical protein